MSDDHVTLKLNRDQALVLSDWLDRVMGTETFDCVVDEEPAVWSALYEISGSLETSLREIFMPDYGDRLAVARQRLLDELGDAFRTLPAADDAISDTSQRPHGSLTPCPLRAR